VGRYRRPKSSILPRFFPIGFARARSNKGCSILKTISGDGEILIEPEKGIRPVDVTGVLCRRTALAYGHRASFVEVFPNGRIPGRARTAAGGTM
jgi:hypothetical protein